MSKIKILPEILSNKIAAGEVVERPAAVVKELVENALDAESTRIFIEIERGGRSLIRVSDNGIGMNRDDAMLAVERYATSKIFTDRDLFSIRTLGFRGEALPSIASVSRFLLVTREREADIGTAVDLVGGKLTSVTDVGAPVGTMVTVRQLFYNTPARRKFLKTINTEMGHIGDTVVHIALGRPEIQFRLDHDGKTIRNWPAVAEPVDRVVDVLGKEMRGHLLHLEYESSDVTVDGWIGTPRTIRGTARGIFVYVNGRFVRDLVVQHALLEGYTGRLMKGQYPVAVLFIRIPFEGVDVNVHPTKHRVRFATPDRVHLAVKTAVLQALHGSDRAAWVTPSARSTFIAEGIERYGEIAESSKLKAQRGQVVSHLEASTENRKSKIENQTSLWPQKPFGDLKIIGQLHQTYILCESREGLVLIDQHAAHERIRFEQLKSMPNRSSQGLLLSETLELSHSEAETLERLIPELKAYGLHIEPFGGTTFVVKSVPALLSESEMKSLLTEMVEKATDVGFGHGMARIIEGCLIVMACHGTVRAKQRLAPEEMRALLDALDACENPSHCPHGRPIWVSWPLGVLERSFGRIN